MKFWAITSAAGLVVCPCALADTFWNEITQGDLSGDRMNPTMFTLGEGTHTLMGHTMGGDLDYMAITLAAGMQLRQLILVSYDSGDGTAFIGMQRGAVFTEPPSGTVVGNLLGWAHFGPFAGNVGTDILDDIGMGFGAMGFTPPLPTDTYTFWIQQLMDETTYRLDFVIGPGPSCYANCDQSTTTPILNVNDFICFNNLYATGSSLANCDSSTIAPILNVNDFSCFLNRYATGCP